MCVQIRETNIKRIFLFFKKWERHIEEQNFANKKKLFHNAKTLQKMPQEKNIIT